MVCYTCNTFKTARCYTINPSRAWLLHLLHLLHLKNDRDEFEKIIVSLVLNLDGVTELFICPQNMKKRIDVGSLVHNNEL